MGELVALHPRPEPRTVAKKPRRQNDGLYKRCKCPKPKWSRCSHPWHYMFLKKTCACELPGWKCEHRRQNRARVSLHAYAKVPADYVMPKDEAEGWCDKIRTAVREGTFRAEVPVPAPHTEHTFNDVSDQFFKRHVQRPGRREGPIKAISNYLRVIRESEVPAPRGGTVQFGAKVITTITKADVEAVREARRAQLKANAEKRAEGKAIGHVVLPGTRGGEDGIRAMMETLRDVFEWAIDEGYREDTPFKRGDRKVVKVRLQKKQRRDRRLDAETNEEQRVLAAARPKGRREGMEGHLYDVIVAALETGCREGELLSLQWKQILLRNGVMDRLDLPADKTKTNEPRQVPITSRLREILEARRKGPDGKDHGPEAYVFGDEVGGQIGRVYTAFKAACRRAKIDDLTFHDLRHEFISRALDRGVPLHIVRDWVGHKNIATTNIYANTTAVQLDAGRALLEAATR